MTFTFYVVDETRMPREGSGGTTPQAVVAAIRERGGRWSTVDADVESFADAFETLDTFVDGEGFLPQLSFSGSPHQVLVGHPGPGRLGYFEASLVPHLLGAFRLLSLEIDEAMEAKNERTVAVYRAFLSALEEADERGYAVAVLHD